MNILMSLDDYYPLCTGNIPTFASWSKEAIIPRSRERGCNFAWFGSGYSSLPEQYNGYARGLCHCAGKPNRPAFAALYSLFGYCPARPRCQVVSYAGTVV